MTSPSKIYLREMPFKTASVNSWNTPVMMRGSLSQVWTNEKPRVSPRWRLISSTDSVPIQNNKKRYIEVIVRVKNHYPSTSSILFRSMDFQLHWACSKSCKTLARHLNRQPIQNYQMKSIVYCRSLPFIVSFLTKVTVNTAVFINGHRKIPVEITVRNFTANKKASKDDIVKVLSVINAGKIRQTCSNFRLTIPLKLAGQS